MADAAETVTNEDVIGRLQEALDESRRLLEPFRVKRREAIIEFVGRHYGDQGKESQVPINMIELATSVYSRRLMPRIPQVSVRARSKENAATALELELATNHVLKEIGFEATAKRFVVDAIFSIGVMFVGYEAVDTVELHGVAFDLNQPFAVNVDLDDFVFDMGARRWDQVQFIGHRYRVSRDILLKSELYNEEAINTHATMERTANNEQGDTRTSALTNPDNREYSEFVDSVELWSVWLPMHGRLLTMLADEAGGLAHAVVIREQPWVGPETGPYTVLCFTDVPANLMPLAPVATWMDLHLAINILERKIIHQAIARKDIGVVSGGTAEDINRLMKAKDGDVVRAENNTKFEDKIIGSVDQVAQSIAIMLQSNAFTMFGNLDSIGGLSPQSTTAAQDQLIAESANVRISEMGSRVSSAINEICRAIAWYLASDPAMVIDITKTIEMPGGKPMELETQFVGGMNDSEWLDLNFDIDAHSQMDDSPAARLARTDRFLSSVMTLYPLMQAQGLQLNVQSILEQYARDLGMTDVGDLITGGTLRPNQSIAAPEAAQGEKLGMGKPASTERRYVRENRSAGPTRQGQAHVMAMQTLGKGVQDKQVSKK